MAPSVIETPNMSVAELIGYDKHKTLIYYDGCEYWTVETDGKIINLGNEAP